MTKPRRTLLLGLASIPLVALLLGLAYDYQRARFTQRVNAVFDPQQHAFRGIYLPWPIGHPTLAGGLDPEADCRIRSLLGYEEGHLHTNGMIFRIHPASGTFLAHAD